MQLHTDLVVGSMLAIAGYTHIAGGNAFHRTVVVV